MHCHRLVLAACSTYFESLLGENPCKHPIIILPRDIKLWEIQALVDFMYKGEVNVSQAGLPDLLKCAEILQIRGLCGSDAALNLNHITNNATTGATATNNSTATITTTASSISSTQTTLTATVPTVSQSIIANPSHLNTSIHLPNTYNNSNSSSSSSQSSHIVTTNRQATSPNTTSSIAPSVINSATTTTTTTKLPSSSVVTTPIVTRSSSGSHSQTADKIIIGAVTGGAVSNSLALDVSSSTQVTNILRTELLTPPTFKVSSATTTPTVPSTAVATAAVSIDDGEDSANGSGSELNIKSEDFGKC